MSQDFLKMIRNLIACSSNNTGIQSKIVEFHIFVDNLILEMSLNNKEIFVVQAAVTKAPANLPDL